MKTITATNFHFPNQKSFYKGKVPTNSMNLTVMELLRVCTYLKYLIDR